MHGIELQSALQYQVLSTGLQRGHLIVLGGVKHQQWRVLPLEKQVSWTHCIKTYILYTVQKHARSACRTALW